MIDPKLQLNEAIDLFTKYLYQKQLQVFSDPRLRVNGHEYPGAVRVGKLMALVDWLNNRRDK